jgi:hypothetical protein
MRIQGAVVQGGLAALGMVLAFTTWRREPDKAPGQVVVIDASKNDVKKVHFTDDKGGFVELTRADDGVWLRVSARGEGKAHTPERELRGSEAAEKLLDSFGPLRATRALGVPAEDKLVEYGLADAPPKDDSSTKKPDGGVAKHAEAPAKKPTVRKRFEVTARGEAHAFTVGAGGASFVPYLRDEHDGQVYLLGGSLVSDLDSAATRMVERGLHGFKPGDFDGVTVIAGGKRRDLRVLAADKPLEAKLASAKTPDKPDEMARSWHDKVWRLFPVEVLGRNETPAAGAPQTVVRVEYASHGRQQGFVEIGRVAAPAPANTSAAPPPAEIYARSEHTAGWVKLTTAAEDVIKDAEKIAAGD